MAGARERELGCQRGVREGSLGAREVCEREGAWQALEKGSSGAREVCERGAWCGGEPERERCEREESGFGRGVWEERLHSVSSLPFLLSGVLLVRERRLCSSSEDRHCLELGGV